jgi:hypothetical protein
MMTQFRIFSPFTLHHSSLNCVESEFFAWVVVGGDELSYCIEDNLEVLIVFFLKFFDFFSARSLFDCMRERSRTKIHMMAMFTSTARGERRTLESMATPCSVKS